MSCILSRIFFVVLLVHFSLFSSHAPQAASAAAVSSSSGSSDNESMFEVFEKRSTTELAKDTAKALTDLKMLASRCPEGKVPEKISQLIKQLSPLDILQSGQLQLSPVLKPQLKHGYTLNHKRAESIDQEFARLHLDEKARPANKLHTSRNESVQAESAAVYWDELRALSAQVIKKELEPEEYNPLVAKTKILITVLKSKQLYKSSRKPLDDEHD